MGDTRDPERDQPLPRPGGIPVQEVMIRSIEERRDYGTRKYGRPLEAHNGRDALTDAWEEALDLLTYLTQMRLERGDVLPGVTGAGRICTVCRHEPHAAGKCQSKALNLGCGCLGKL